jgi:Tol biopolymer transport system component
MTKLSSRIGIVRSARFAPDGKSVVYTAAWNGGPQVIYAAQAGAAAARELVQNAELLAVSARGDLAVLVKPYELQSAMAKVARTGTLARTHLQGGALRELSVGIMDADFLPDGELVVARYIQRGSTSGTHARITIEWPLGSAAAYTAPVEVMAISGLRASPDGTRLAFIQYRHEDQGEIMVIDRSGVLARLRGNGDRRVHLDGLAWSADGSELLAGLGEVEGERCVYALALSGERRALQCAAGNLSLQDRSTDGRMLITSAHTDTRLRYQLPGSNTERELPLSRTSVLEDVTADGKRIVYGEPAGKGNVYIRDLEAAEPVRISDGLVNGGISPDGKWVGVSRLQQLGSDKGPTRHHYFVPTGAGVERERALYPSVEQIPHALSGWTPDSKYLVNACLTKDGPQTCAHGLDGAPRIISRVRRPGATLRRAVSPDGRWYLASDGTSVLELISLDGTKRRALPSTPALNAVGPAGSAGVIGWSDDGDAVYAAGDPSSGHELSVVRIDLETGESTPWRVLRPDDRAGELTTVRAFVIGDGEGYVYSFRRTQSELYLLEPQSR